ncbi:hypothetical protein [Pararhodobacter oceanensis]|uniref:hypothetical protein n=1 Tax=Pararhodobacter oceanensis TaxID=2172121 RepID=UPI000E3042AD|nr:hypothetical protein [Pararhodobacter oceanensis]
MQAPSRCLRRSGSAPTIFVKPDTEGSLKLFKPVHARAGGFQELPATNASIENSASYFTFKAPPVAGERCGAVVVGHLFESTCAGQILVARRLAISLGSQMNQIL